MLWVVLGIVVIVVLIITIKTTPPMTDTNTSNTTNTPRPQPYNNSNVNNDFNNNSNSAPNILPLYHSNPYSIALSELSFTAIDFETANTRKTSACQLGLVVVKKGEIIERKSWLIKPLSKKFTFTDLHGITYDMVKDAPNFKELWPHILEYIEGQIIAAHYAHFDISVLMALLKHYELEIPDFRVTDSSLISKRTWSFLRNHKLPTVAKHLDIKFKHHEAENDAVACAKIIIAAQANSFWFPLLSTEDTVSKREYMSHWY